MDVTVYIKRSDDVGYLPLDLFKDEKIEINLAVKNLSDISKIRTDFSQSFTIPCSPKNNQIFEYWYGADVDGAFNANIRVDAYIEVNATPFRFGSVQLDNCKLKNGLPNSYSITFFGNGVNLSDKFGDDLLSSLPLSDYDHDYGSSVLNAINDTHLSSGDVYYPLISATSYLEYGTASAKDINHTGNDTDYRDFKPALRILRIIEAIETKYNITFSRDFFDRAVFYNLFMWLHKEQGRMLTSSTALEIDFNLLTNVNTDWAVTTPEINITTNSAIVDWANNNNTGYLRRVKINLSIYSTSTNNYKVEVYDNGQLYDTFNSLIGNSELLIYDKLYSDDNTNHLFTFKVSSIQGTISFSSRVNYRAYRYISGTGYEYRVSFANTATLTTTNSIVKIKEQIPELKVKDFFTSLVNQFNLILKPTSSTHYFIDTLDNWYSNGNAYDISNLVDLKDITINKPKAKKKIDFVYQKTDTILGKQYYDINNQIGYGDLKAVYNIQGEELKIESQFENLMFERLYDKSLTTPAPIDLNAGYAIDLNLNPIKGKPFLFYRNGFDNGFTLKIQPSFTYTTTWHTATEDNREFSQVTNSLNFGADNSTWFYAPIDTGLYYNFWKTYIEDLFNKKTRVLNLKGKIPVRILQKLGLNDRFIIGDKKYKISTLKVDLTSSEADIEIFTDLSNPLDSVNNIIPITVDSTDYTVDSTYLTVDTTTIHEPVTSYTINGVSLTEYNASKGEEHFELKIDANTNWHLVTSDSWISTNKTTGKRSDYVRVSLPINSGSARTGTITVTIGATDFTITINQL